MVQNQIIRFGAYGILMRDGQLFLTRKKGGPFLGLWDLPGGGIEFGETPIQALEREIREETGFAASGFTLFDVVSTTTSRFHFLGVIYRVESFVEIPGAVAEEEGRWFDLPLEEATPQTLQISGQISRQILAAVYNFELQKQEIK